MNTFRKNLFNYQSRKVYHRFIHVKTEQESTPQWLKPIGYETNITIYNPVAKCKVPLILKNKNFLTWYVCGPTVYDSAHIGHAMTYMNLDIIRRILTDHFNINVIMVMCITDIDDKIIESSKRKQQNYKDFARYYENEFMEDMNKLNVINAHLYCRVTDYIPEIIQFVNGILKKGYGYITTDGSVYFDTSTYNMYGKLGTPLENSTHPDKKSTLDFCLWKASKEGEPFWESPWGKGRPGWHIECSTIASSVFGNCVDIHSGGIDLAFPHHENEEAQSCCYHEVQQWVNYWLHCGHLFLEDTKMSKSLNNTISIRKFLTKHTANHLRILCLLSNYKNGMKFSDIVLENAVSILHKIEHFVNDCNNYINGRGNIGNVDELTLLDCLDKTKSCVDIALADDFNTAKAMKSLLSLIDLVNKMLQGPKDSDKRSVPAIAAVSNYISTMLAKFGILHSSAVDDHRINNLVECFVKFRNTVRNRVLEQSEKDKIILKACDEARSNLLVCGVTIKDYKSETVWSIKKY